MTTQNTGYVVASVGSAWPGRRSGSVPISHDTCQTHAVYIIDMSPRAALRVGPDGPCGLLSFAAPGPMRERKVERAVDTCLRSGEQHGTPPMCKHRISVHSHCASLKLTCRKRGTEKREQSRSGASRRKTSCVRPPALLTLPLPLPAPSPPSSSELHQ